MAMTRRDSPAWQRVNGDEAIGAGGDGCHCGDDEDDAGAFGVDGVVVTVKGCW